MLTPMELDNLDLIVKDVQKSVDFYHGVLGLPFALPYDPSEGWAALQAGSVTLFVFRTSSDVQQPARAFDASSDPPGLSAYGLTVEDLDAAIAGLDGKVEWVAEARSWHHPSGTWYRFRGFYDPEGNVVSITEAHKSA